MIKQKMSKLNESLNLVEYYVSIYVGCNKEEPRIICSSISYKKLNEFLSDFIGKNISDLETENIYDYYSDNDDSDLEDDSDFKLIETYKLDQKSYSKIKDKLNLMHFCNSRIVIYKSKSGNFIDILNEIKDIMV